MPVSIGMMCERDIICDSVCISDLGNIIIDLEFEGITCPPLTEAAWHKMMKYIIYVPNLADVIIKFYTQLKLDPK